MRLVSGDVSSHMRGKLRQRERGVKLPLFRAGKGYPGPLFSWLGRFAFRNRWRVVFAWGVVLFLGVIFAPRAGSALSSGFGEFDTEARQGLEILEEKLGFTATVIDVVFSSQSLTVDDPRYRQEVEHTLAGLEGFPRLERIETFYNGDRPWLASEDRRTMFVQVWLDVDLAEAQDLVPEFRRSLNRSDQLRVLVTGSAPIFADLDKAIESDLRRAEFITFPLVVLALLIVFGTVVAAGLPVLIGAMSLAVTLALLYGLAQVIQVSVFSQNVASFLAIGLSVDYALVMVSRFREELQRGRGVEEGVVVTTATAGKAIFFSGFTTALGLAELTLIGVTGLRSLGLGGVIVVSLSVALALTLIPAVLGALGYRVNALRVLPGGALRETGRWAWLATRVMRHPLLVLLPILVFLLLLGSPFLRVRLGTTFASILPRGAEARQGWDLLNQEFGEGQVSPTLVVVSSDGTVRTPERVGALYDYTRELAGLPGVTGVQSIVGPDLRLGGDNGVLSTAALDKEAFQRFLSRPDLIPIPELRERVQATLGELSAEDATFIRVFSDYPTNSPEARQLVKEIRSFNPGEGLSRHVSGATAGLMDWTSALYREVPKALAFVVVSIYLALLVLFRSVVLPLKAVFMNFLSISASFGALVFIFQEGHFQGLLNFQAQGYLEASVPVILFAILYGLSMDYEVFLLARVKEEYDLSGDNTASVALGLERTGRIITSAAMILVVVAGSFATGDNVIVKALGVGTALAVFLDATVVRALLVPATMRLLGRWNWWAPSFLQRWLPELEGPQRV